MSAAIPDPEQMPYPLAPQNFTQAPVVWKERILFSDDNLDIQPADSLENIMIITICHVMGRHVEVYVLIVIAIEQIPESIDMLRQIISTAESDDTIEGLRVPKRYIHCMVSAEAATVRDQKWCRVDTPTEWQNFMKYVLFIENMPLDSITRLTPIAIKCLVVYGIDTENLEPALFQMVAHRLNQAHIFVIIKAAHPGRKGEDPRTGVAEDKQFHVATKSMTVPFVVFAFHGGDPRPMEAIAGVSGRTFERSVRCLVVLQSRDSQLRTVSRRAAHP